MDGMTENSACYFTQQVFLIGTHGEDGTAHFAPYSWVSFSGGPPRCLVLSINGNYRKKNTAQNIDRTGVFSATVVTPDLLPFAEKRNLATRGVATPFSRAMEEGRVLRVPLLAGAAWAYECEVVEHVRIGGTDTYFGAIRSVNTRDDLAALPFIDLRAIDPVVYAPGHYYRVTEHLGAVGEFAERA